MALRDRVRAKEKAAAGGAQPHEAVEKVTPAPALAGPKRRGDEEGRGGGAGGGSASARWDALRRRVRAREEGAAQRTAAAERGGEAVHGARPAVGRAVGVEVAMSSRDDRGDDMQLD